MRALAVSFRLSEQGIILRYEGQKLDRGVGRWTTPEAHKAGYEGMPTTIERIERELLTDRLTLYRRNTQIIYTNELRDGKWLHEPRARAALEAERERPLSVEEQRDYLKGFDRLTEMLTRPERGASREEIDQIDTMRQQAAKELNTAIKKQCLQEAIENLGKNVEKLFHDSRFSRHNQNELKKAAYWRGVFEYYDKAHGKNPNDLLAFEERLADRVALGQMPDVAKLNDLEIQFDSSQPQERSNDLGR